MTLLPLVLAAGPLDWIFSHVPQVLFIMFFIAPAIGQMFKRKRDAEREASAKRELPVPSGTTEARVPDVARPDEDLQQRVRRYFEQITGQTEAETQRDAEPEPELEPERRAERVQHEQTARHEAQAEAQKARGPSESQHVRSVFAPIPQTFVKGEVDFDPHMHHTEIAPQTHVTRRFAGASVSSQLLDLHDPWALRRAIVLREVLGLPLALREHADV